MKKALISTGLIASILVPVGLVISCSNDGNDDSKSDEKMHTVYQTPTPIANIYNIPKKVEVIAPPKLIKKEIVAPPLEPTMDQLVKPEPIKLNRSGIGTWTTNIQHEAVMRNGFSKAASTIHRHENVLVDVYETALFKYAVDMTAVMGKDRNGNAKPITHQKIENIVKIFERHVNYGPGAHMKQGLHTLEYVDKLTIEFFRSSPSIPGLSVGSTAGVEVSLHKNFGNTFTMAGLLLHEYGHHETLIDAKVFHDSRTYKRGVFVKWIDTFAKFRNDLKADPELAKFTKYFNDRYDIDDMDGYHIDKDIATPIGTIHKGAYAFGGSKYTFSSAEFVTRALMLLEMSETKQTLMNEIQYRAELAGFMNEFSDSPISDHLKQKFIDLFIKDIFAIDSFAEEGRDRVIDEHYKAVVNGVIATRDISSKQIDHVKVQMISREGLRTNIDVSKDMLKKELGEYHFNTNFDNTSPEISRQIYMYSIDTNKLSESDAEQVKNWLNFTAQITFYDAENNVMGTTGHL